MYSNFQIKDKQSDEIVVDRLLDLTQANDTMLILKEKNPYADYEIIEKKESTVKPGFGRDPDLH